ncbi:MAG: HAD-IA family hydrolase [Planctomycetota bacterium]|jgi:putative hydrolase of the HAD superfamily
MQLRALSLDVGGTLVYERPSRYAIYAEAGRQRGLQVSDEGMRERMGRAHHGLPREIDGAFRYSDPWFRRFIEAIYAEGLGLPRAELGPLTEELFERFQDPGTFRLFPGVPELLGAARALGLRVGVTSNWSARLPQVLDALDLSGELDFVVCSAIERCEKPEPRIFELAAERAACEPAAVLHVGDRPDFDGAARSVGMQVVLVDHFRKLAGDELPGPDGQALPVVRDLDALREHLQQRA